LEGATYVYLLVHATQDDLPKEICRYSGYLNRQRNFGHGAGLSPEL